MSCCESNFLPRLAFQHAASGKKMEKNWRAASVANFFLEACNHEDNVTVQSSILEVKLLLTLGGIVKSLAV